MARPVVIVLAAVVLTGVVLGGSGRMADAWAVPGLNIQLDQPTTRQAIVTEEQNGSVTFSGSIRTDPLPVERVIVNFTATLDAEWECKLNPNQIVLTDSKYHPFNVTIYIPRATSANAVGHLIVWANATPDGYDLASNAVATLTVAPYFKFFVYPDSGHREILPGDGANFIIGLQNYGNSVDSYELVIANAGELKGTGWSVNLSKRWINSVAVNQTVNVSVTARSPQGWSWDVRIDRPALILVNVSSLGARNTNITVARTLPIQLTVRGTNNPLLELITTVIIFTAVGITIFAVMRRRQKRRLPASTKEGS